MCSLSNRGNPGKDFRNYNCRQCVNVPLTCSVTNGIVAADEWKRKAPVETFSLM